MSEAALRGGDPGPQEVAAAAADELLTELERFEGLPAGPAMRAPDPVNQAMIRHWVEAMGDENPVYVDEDAARANGFAGVIAPPTMMQAWTMRGYRATAQLEAARRARAGAPAGQGSAGEDIAPLDRLFALLDSAGFTSVVATNCEQHYDRPLELGDHVDASSVIESISARKSTALGEGYFVTTRTDFTDQRGEPVGKMRFRILRFRPRPAPASGHSQESTPRPKRPRPALTEDNSFFFEGAKEHRLLVQRCCGCATLRHPPGPACPRCGSLDWDTIESSGRGRLFSYVVVHHPQVPGFDYPLPIGLVELEEGTRLVSDIVGADPVQLSIDMPLQCEFVSVDDELTLPVFRPARGAD